MSSKATTANKKSKDQWESLVGDTDPRVDELARERIIQARIMMLFQNPFFGNLSTRLQLVNADDWLETAATDGRHFYYNSRFIMKLQPDEVPFLVGHEVLHCAYDHMGRREYRNPQISNIAADYCVNADLKKHGIGQFITTVPCLYEKKYEGWTYEDVYDDLYDNANKIDISDLIDQLLDDHMDDDGSDGAGGDGDEEGDGRPRLSKEERDEIRREFQQAVIQAAQQSEAGKLPAGIRRMVKEMTEPQMDWRELIDTNLTSTIKTDYSFMRPNRRAWHMDAILPGMTPGEEIDIVLTIDMSGSITDKMARDCISEVKGIMEAFDGYRIHLFTFDTKVYNPQTYTSDTLEEISEYDLQGGGGTDFHCVQEYLRENDIEPQQLVVFTDCEFYGSTPFGDENLCDTTWIIHSNPSCVPPYGTYAHYSEA